ncbi:unnamed protein product [Vitrella brassicaformis CCMP3155]|uniref:TLDc domain-containing protein n=1 Tax=Vitrella brassicaformis (strain CCMP3155) TaxID=1169540 RepID=A0A0G4F5Y2_VITBC|nr:unnamed protein product [Vitrella brassicaformis CCMP3155]|eukprot:CEM07781.1 unnamed protein product [Vitrella brassicaformis CCMP3155]
MLNPWRWLKALFTTLAARDGGASSEASANVPSMVEPAVSAADVPQDVALTIAEYVRSYSQLEALIDAHPTQFTSALLLPILTRLLPVVVEGSFGSVVDVPVPQLSQDAAVVVAITRRLMMLEYGRDLSRWRPHLELLYHIRGKRPVVLGDEHFSAFDSRAAFIGETEAVRQWKILSRGVTVRCMSYRCCRHQQMRLMDGNAIRLHRCGYRLPALLTSASPLFPHDTFVDAADPPTQLDGYVYALTLLWWRSSSSDGFGMAATSVSPEAQRGALTVLLVLPHLYVWGGGGGAAVFDRRVEVHHERLVVLGGELMGEGDMVLIRLEDWGDKCHVDVHKTWSLPFDRARTAVKGMLGEHLGGAVWGEGSGSIGCIVM